MNTGFATRMIAAIAALSAFAVAIVSGLSAGNDSALVLRHALSAMLIGFVGGAVVGMIGERTVREHIERYRKQSPENPSAVSTASGSLAESESSTDSPPQA